RRPRQHRGLAADARESSAVRADGNRRRLDRRPVHRRAERRQSTRAAILHDVPGHREPGDGNAARIGARAGHFTDTLLLVGLMLIDLSHDIEQGMVTYKGMPGPTIADWLSRDASRARYTPGTTFQIGKIDLLANTGTYIDAPFHRYEGAPDIAGYALETVANVPALVVRATPRAGRALDASRFAGLQVQ